MKLGFVLLTHNNPNQAIRLMKALDRMFPGAPVVCHHDFGKSPFPIDNAPSNVEFVHPHIETGYGRFSIVEATVAAMSRLFSRAGPPDWFTLLSGSDYPIKPAKNILGRLSVATADAFIQSTPVRPDMADMRLVTRPPVPLNDHWWQAECAWRYCRMPIRVPVIGRNLRPKRKQIWLPPKFSRPFLPFGRRQHRCFSGLHWFTANRKCSEYILERTDKWVSLAKHYREVVAPEESYFQTVIGNNPKLTIENDNLRYVRWSAKTTSPDILTTKDLCTLQESTAHFARKFDLSVDEAVLDQLDDLI